ncbi:hypothetical protein [Georgenia deserti]|uniref:Uncharacterized protein n=1 Tax=Georgenia deserti TaxID=2093781 RepID=A0ABW4L4X0_9MICO
MTMFPSGGTGPPHVTVLPPRSRRWPWVVGVVVLLVWAVTATGLLFVQGDGEADGRGGAEPDERALRIADDLLFAELTVPRSMSIRDIDTREGAEHCGPVRRYTLGDSVGDRGLWIELVPTDCPDVGGMNRRIGNGFHGLYRTIDDVDDPRDVAEVSTDLGEAVIFEQLYYECTNSCTDDIEPVAIISVDRPRDSDYPTVVLHVSGDELGREQLADIVATVQEPSV